MVANISQTGDIDHFATARQHAWHRLGPFEKVLAAVQ